MYSLPTFMIVGAAKCGTTSLSAALASAPDILMPSEKEPKYFSVNFRPKQMAGPGDSEAYENKPRTLDAYRRLFEAVPSRVIVGEASTDYLYYQDCADEIRRICGDIRIIIVLRDPVKRAFSNYLHMRRDGREYLAFADALAKERLRREQGYEYAWHYFENGCYADRVRKFQETFSMVRVIIYEEFFQDPLLAYNELLEFVGSEKRFSENDAVLSTRRNVSGIPISGPVYRRARVLANTGFLRMVRRSAVVEKGLAVAQRFMLKRPCLDPTVGASLVRRYRTNIAQLEEMIGRDLRMWEH
jgi:hypothetical protein